MLLAVNFHYISETCYEYPGIHPVSPESFERQLDLLRRDFQFVGLDDLEAHLDRKRILPVRSCLITFDDGLREQYEIAWSILRRKGIPAAFFVNTYPTLSRTVATVHKIHFLRAHTAPKDFLDGLQRIASHVGIELNTRQTPPPAATQQYRYDSEEARQIKYVLNFLLRPTDRRQIIDEFFSQRYGDEADFSTSLYMQPAQWRELTEAGCLGTHSHRHEPLATLARPTIEREIRESCAQIAAHTGRSPIAVSYPFGGPSAVCHEVADVAAELGLKIGLTMERAFNETLDSPLLLARADTNDVPGGSRPAFTMSGGVPCITGKFSLRRTTWMQEAA